ncbi:MAG TPA: PstS family phosphate ABC transporter substrate-binding protein [Tepidisphaeraceae bacterium]|jgi:phosphate transport system substrate-binding protein
MLSFIRTAALTAAVVTTLGGAMTFAASMIKIDGSSTVYPITEAVAEEFQKEKKGEVKVTVGISGTGGGFKKFVRGETDISNASRPILQKEIDEAKTNGIEYIELPVAFDALTIVVNPSNDFLKEIKVDELKKMWGPDAEGKVMSWNQVNPAWPEQALKLFGPGPDSGTFDYFTEAVNGKSKASRKDYTPSEDDNVLVQGVSSDKGAIGYFGLAYYEANKGKLRAVPVVNKEGKAVMPSVETTKDGSYNPLARPIFIYVNKKSMEKPEVKQFVEFYIKNAEDLVSDVKYVPLPKEAYKMASARVAAGKTGSVFGGKDQVGMTTEQLFTNELK